LARLWLHPEKATFLALAQNFPPDPHTQERFETERFESLQVSQVHSQQPRVLALTQSHML